MSLRSEFHVYAIESHFQELAFKLCLKLWQNRGGSPRGTFSFPVSDKHYEFSVQWFRSPLRVVDYKLREGRQRHPVVRLDLGSPAEGASPGRREESSVRTRLGQATPPLRALFKPKSRQRSTSSMETVSSVSTTASQNTISLDTPDPPPKMVERVKCLNVEFASLSDANRFITDFDAVWRSDSGAEAATSDQTRSRDRIGPSNDARGPSSQGQEPFVSGQRHLTSDNGRSPSVLPSDRSEGQSPPQNDSIQWDSPWQSPTSPTSLSVLSASPPSPFMIPHRLARNSGPSELPSIQMRTNRTATDLVPRSAVVSPEEEELSASTAGWREQNSARLEVVGEQDSAGTQDAADDDELHASSIPTEEQRRNTTHDHYR
ncbi:hypothetical protein BAUCODRAFT_263320 [Baudoinia panamericana UAMH 10762]|uniref:Uncharacterized protein n=1 Tax=Baudoinia panamericana (strain UAMH 10762) TaxID=717646 RepID=M2LFL1_BAUPA|nr:uncharacterized protein BAUCODRAFT_263320 [Baudoinia panamericana UAMH 10762]EMC92832.1 hypothetical protein BAUCODRAFT_263320 [Baudoinia panamericana UAMH 10762]